MRQPRPQQGWMVTVRNRKAQADNTVTFAWKDEYLWRSFADTYHVVRISDGDTVVYQEDAA